MTAKTRDVVAIALGISVILGLLAYVYSLLFWPDHKLQRDVQSLIGKTEAAVIEKMGAPHKVVTASDVTARPKEAWWGSGWHPAPAYPVRNRVLLYYGTVTGALIYVGSTGAVE